jgi:polysaccharide deacetylase family protein (PEP-CTERM system associated)
MNPPAPGLLSVDVEEWFHILDLDTAPKRDCWDRLPSRVERNFNRLLDVFSEAGVQATCFFLGYVAKRYPHLVKRAADLGHEIASHGFNHELAYQSSPEEFLEDALTSRQLLEDLSAKKVTGYRAAGFSVTKETPWFFDKVVEAGYEYDSSVFPGSRQHGGLEYPCNGPHLVRCDAGILAEIPISLYSVLGLRFCFSGGGYLRLFPYRLIRSLVVRTMNQGNPVTFYTHPRDIDPDQPRIKMGLVRSFKSYIGLNSTEQKIRRLAREFVLKPYGAYLDERRRTREEFQAVEKRLVFK